LKSQGAVIMNTDMSPRQKCLGILLVALWAGTGGGTARAEISDEQRVRIAERLRESTVTVLAGEASGSGFVVAPHGWIVTNAHVASGARWSGRLRVRFSDGSLRAATLIAYDAQHDLAVVRLASADTEAPPRSTGAIARTEATPRSAGAVPRTETRVRPLPLGDSDDVRVGQTVLAFGSPFGLEGTLTQGIVSARRDVGAIGNGAVRSVIQTDAPINPGNSGGPLVNAKGEVIGINTAIVSRSGASSGIGFAVPSSYVKALLDEMERALGKAEHGELAARDGNPKPGQVARTTDRVWLGVNGEDFRARGYRGVRVIKVVPQSPAERAGLLGAADAPPPFIEQLGIPWTGHIILAIDSHPVHSMAELAKLLARHLPGEQALVTVTVGPGVVTGETIVDLGVPPPR
jgi:S1-C subfamily serine protease